MYYKILLFIVQSLSHVWLFMPCGLHAAHQASLSFSFSRSLLKLMSTESVMASNHFILCCPLLHLPSIFPSIRVFSNELALHIRQSQYWNFSFSPSNEYSELISFRIDGLVWSPCCPRGSQESSPAPQFKSINSWAFKFIYGPTLTCAHDYWKNHTQFWLHGPLWCLCFLIHCLGLS